MSINGILEVPLTLGEGERLAEVQFRRSVGEVIIGTSDHKNTKRIGDVGEGMHLCQCENKNVSFYI